MKTAQQARAICLTLILEKKEIFFLALVSATTERTVLEDNDVFGTSKLDNICKI